jgi:methylmalonyl-CoA mutase
VRDLRQRQQPAHQRLDEAVTTPSAHSVRRALAIQMIIDQEWGLAGNENPLQGSFVVDELTDLVEEACSPSSSGSPSAGGVLGRDGDRLPAGPHPGRVDALRAPQARRHLRSSASTPSSTPYEPDATPPPGVELARGTVQEKSRSWPGSPTSSPPTPRPRAWPAAQAAASGGNVFEVLMDAVRVCSLGQVPRRSSRSAGSIVAPCDPGHAVQSAGGAAMSGKLPFDRWPRRGGCGASTAGRGRRWDGA